MRAKIQPEDIERIAELVESALEHDSAERARYLDEACRNDDALRKEAESLLSYEEQSEGLETPAYKQAAEAVLEAPGKLVPGEVLGNYKIVSLVGVGGMGEVYLAEDAALGRKVALKLVKAGFDNATFLRHFRNEERILAGLTHPNIARLYGGDVTPDGLPYFVMEYVEGQRIDHYCREHRLTLRQRLDLFRKVCAAVAYAHQHLVIHRDLKPVNIRVTPEGEPKLLDFGIAKLLDSESGLPNEQTITLQALMTPDYASPEQAGGEMMTTASDVYSLGVVLYELLTGDRPYRFKTRRPDGIARTITEEEPRKPSAAVANNQQAGISSQKSLKGDLDNIILKALRKETERRYSSAAQLSEDIRRHLAGLPVSARKDTLTYRGSKFVRRHRVAVAAGVIVLVAIIGGLAISLWEAEVARRETTKAEAVSDFLQEMLSTASPGATLHASKDKVTVKDVLDKASKDLASEKLSSQPEVKAELLRVIGSCYFDLGQYDVAEQNLRAAAQLERQIYGQNSLETLKTLTVMAGVWLDKGEIVKGDKFYAKTIPILRSEQKKGRVSAEYLMEALYNYALTRRLLSDPKEGERLLREVLSLSAQAGPSARAQIDITESVLTITLCDQGKFEEAEKMVRAQLESFRHRGDVSDAAAPVALQSLGLALMEQGKFAEAEQTLREAGTIYRKTHDPFYMPLGNDLRLLAEVLYREGKYTEAESGINETLKIYRTSSGPGYTNYPTALTIQGLIYSKTSRATEAEKLLREAVQIRSQSVPDNHFLKALAVGALGEFLTDQDRFAEAEPLLLNSYESLRESQIANSSRVRTALQRLVTLYEKSNKPNLATKYRSGRQ